MASDLDLLLERLCLMEKEVVPGSDAVPVAFYAQEATPFWTNRQDTLTVELNGLGIYVATYRIVMRLVLGKITEDYATVAEQRINQWVPVVLDFFARRRNLQCAAGTSQLTNMDPRGAVILEGRALYSVQDSGIGVNDFGVEFVLEVPYAYEIEQAYF